MATNLFSTVSIASSEITDGTIAAADVSGDIPVSVADRTALKALATSRHTTAFLEESGREGTFVFRSGNYSSQVTADTREAIYIAATDTASSSGAWVRVYDEAVYANWWGLTADGAGGTDNTAALQAAIDFRDAGKLVIPPGDYECTTKLDIDEKNNVNDATQKVFCIEGYGAVLHFSSITAGNTCVLIDDCKYTHIRGLEFRSANGGRIELDGFWRSKMEDVNAAQLTLVVAPQDLDSFDSHYWNHFDRCHFKAIEFYTGTGGGVDLTEFNSNIFTACNIGPRPELSETGAAYAISIYGTGAMQGVVFNVCDLSYYTTGCIYVDDTLDNGTIDFYSCYFDSSGDLTPSDTKNLVVNYYGSNTAASSPEGDRARLSTGSAQNLSFRRGARNGSRIPIAGQNLVKNGDLSDGASEITLSGGSITVTPTAGEGLFGQYVNITTSVNRTAKFTTLAAPYDGFYTWTVIIRNNGDDLRSVYLVNSSSVTFDAIEIPADSEWTICSFTPLAAVSQGDVLEMQFFGASTYNLDYDIAYVGCTYGVTSPINATAHPDAGSASQWTYRGVAATVPSTPATGRHRRFVDDIGFAWIQDDNGRLRIDNASAGNHVVGIRAIVNSTSESSLGAFAGTDHGTATAQNVASTNYFTRKPRQNNVSAASSGADCGQTFNTIVYLTDPARVRIVAGWETFQTGAAALIGLATSGALGNADASARTNFIGLGLDAGDTTWSLMHNDGTGAATEVALGANYPANTSATDLYELILWWDASPSTVYYQVCRLNSPANTTQGTITTEIPSTSNSYSLHALANTRAGTSALGLSWSSVYVETL